VTKIVDILAVEGSTLVIDVAVPSPIAVAIDVIAPSPIAAVDIATQGPKGDPGDPAEGGGGGTTILNGSGPPAALLGAAGNYYIDSVGQDMYGPKNPDPFLPPANAVSNIGPPADLNFAPYRLASVFTIITHSQIVGARFWRADSSSYTTRQLFLYNDATNALIGTTNFTDESIVTGWVEVAFPAPIDIPLGTRVAICKDDNLYQTGAPTMVNPAHATYYQGTYGTIGAGKPTLIGSFYWVDIKLRATNTNAWPLAVPGA